VDMFGREIHSDLIGVPRGSEGRPAGGERPGWVLADDVEVV
jgi:hypothetical protein